MAKGKENKQTEVYRVVYSEEQYKKDKANLDNAKTLADVNWKSFERLMMRDIAINTSVLQNHKIGRYTHNDIDNALKYPYHNWKMVLAISETLMHISPYYMRINHLFSNMALFQWWVDLYDVSTDINEQQVEQLKKRYSALTSQLEKMQLKHEFYKIMKVLPYKDVFFGLVLENGEDSFIQEVDYSICRLYRIEDGIYNFAINLAAIKPNTISAYPDYVQKEYFDFVNGVKKQGKNITEIKSSWYQPPSDKQICVKFNSQYSYPYPIFFGLLRDILDMDTYKKLKLQSARTDNYKAILMKVPIDEKAIDKPLLTPDVLGVFAEINRASMSDDIGLIYTLGSNGEAISFKDSNNTRNNVADSTDDILNSAGVSKELFNGSASATAVKLSIENLSGYTYGVYRQLERWVNRFIKRRKYNRKNFKFNFYILNSTIFNRDEVSQRYKDACSLGLAVIDKWLASLDMTPSRMLGATVLHKQIFDFENNCVHLSSSFNASPTENNAGRPTNESQGKSLEATGEQTADGDLNER